MKIKILTESKWVIGGHSYIFLKNSVQELPENECKRIVNLGYAEYICEEKSYIGETENKDFSKVLEKSKENKYMVQKKKTLKDEEE